MIMACAIITLFPLTLRPLFVLLPGSGARPQNISLWPAGTMPGFVMLQLFGGWRKSLTKEGLQRAHQD